MPENRAMDVRLDVCWSLGSDSPVPMDALVFDLLEAVERGCSLRSAASRCGASYRHAWGLMRVWEARLGAPLLDLERGRGATLSAVGRSLLWAQRRAQARLAPMLESLSGEVEHELGELLARSTPLKMIASHDLALDLLRERFNALEGTALNLQYRGSLDAVRQLVAGHCDVAGYHLPGWTRPGKIETGFSRLMPPGDYQSVHFVTRRQGLMLRRGLSASVTGLQDLPASGLKFLNRQPGSGTRLLFDELLVQTGVRPGDILGYEVEEFTHLAVAAMLASGAADVGFGVQAAAERFGLEFLPMAHEHYLLAFRSASQSTEWCQDLLKILRNDQALRDNIGQLSGYGFQNMGESWSR
ncbi:MAG: substrate-binding domain-containing protein [Wenzhouxiangella sp.]